MKRNNKSPPPPAKKKIKSPPLPARKKNKKPTAASKKKNKKPAASKKKNKKTAMSDEKMVEIVKKSQDRSIAAAAARAAVAPLEKGKKHHKQTKRVSKSDNKVRLGGVQWRPAGRAYLQHLVRQGDEVDVRREGAASERRELPKVGEVHLVLAGRAQRSQHARRRLRACATYVIPRCMKRGGRRTVPRR